MAWVSLAVTCIRVDMWQYLITDHCSRVYTDGPGKVTVELLEEVYEKLMVAADQPVEAGIGAGGGNGEDYESSHYLKIVDAFDMPALRWAEERKTFEKWAGSVFGLRLSEDLPYGAAFQSRIGTVYSARTDFSHQVSERPLQRHQASHLAQRALFATGDWPD